MTEMKMSDRMNSVPNGDTDLTVPTHQSDPPQPEYTWPEAPHAVEVTTKNWAWAIAEAIKSLPDDVRAAVSTAVERDRVTISVQGPSGRSTFEVYVSNKRVFHPNTVSGITLNSDSPFDSLAGGGHLSGVRVHVAQYARGPLRSA
jgi:hypothetical protein